MKAGIICIGDELLLGQVLDTNSHWLSQELTRLGIEVIQRKIIGDIEKDILNTFSEFKSFELVIITGGLGPTKDDKTKDMLCNFFQTDLKIDQPTEDRVVERITAFLKNDISDELLKLNKKQAEIPSNAKALANEMGTAPGIYIQVENTLWFALPGVPFEMKHIFTDRMIPIIEKKVKQKIIHQSIIVSGIPESKLSILLNDFEDALPKTIGLAYLPSNGMIVLRLTSTKNIQHLDAELLKLKSLCQEYYLCDGDNLLNAFYNKLIQNNFSISTVESCTGGGLASMLTEFSGASAFVKGSIVPYMVESKIKIVGIDDDFFNQYDAVSEECAQILANKGQQIFQSDICISITGLLGPTGGTSDIPIGTVWIGLKIGNKLYSKKLKARWERETNKKYVIMQSLIWMLQLI